ncbi:Pr6Pr family membrane protein [Streptomyces pseudogriseolus]|uniref:Integral membrane regulator n=1 Tax=Streptomyces pseudogriseolus TaxID=36817 RepID=A0ABQ2TNV7_STREZ|nr:MULTISPECIES: Pr6Pr family membrane protein [Streptomyces]MCI4142221.1 Pr6Pr family membrane protein [Streptomyces sp. MMS20-AI2-20]GGQ01798.1 integral membrane regulator [Streptomyces gancidicus]GGS75449.1 integral membrane regulator [Streptomyces rubiginosus]
MTAPIPRDLPDIPALPRTAPQVLPSVVPARAVVPPVRRPLTAVYRLALAVLATAAVLIEVLLGGPTRVLSYFVIQSTVLLALVTLASARRAWTARHPLPGAVTGAALLYVVVASLVHHIALADAAPAYAMTAGSGGGAAWLEPVAGHLLHTVLPVAALLDWLVLTPPARMHLRQATTWLLYPLAYLAFTLTRGELLPGSTAARYLYPFLDVARHGYRSVLANALLVGLAIYAVAVLLVALDHTRPKTRFRL